MIASRIGILLLLSQSSQAFVTPVSSRTAVRPDVRTVCGYVDTDDALFAPMLKQNMDEKSREAPNDALLNFERDSATSTTTESLVAVESTDASSTSKQDSSGLASLTPAAIMRFVAPTLALWMAPPVMSLIDTSVVGSCCGATELASLGPGCTLIDSVNYLFTFLATATTNIVASAKANGESFDGTVSEALFLAAVLGSLLSVLVWTVGRPVLSVIAGQASASVVPAASCYANIRAWGQPASLLASVARATSLACCDTRGPLQSVGLAFVLNALGTLTLTKGLGMGVAGAAIATAGADIAAAVFLMARIWRSRRNSSSEEESVPLIVVPTLPKLRQFARYVMPIFLTLFGKIFIYSAVSVAVGRLGAIALASHEVLHRSSFFWMTVGDSIGMTAQVFLPGIIEEEKRTAKSSVSQKKSLFVAGLIAGVWSAVMAGLLPTKGSFLFTNESNVVSLMFKTAPIQALGVLLSSVALTTEGMLLAQRDMKFLSSSYVISSLLSGLYLMSPWRPVTLGGYWSLLALFQGSRALQFSLRSWWISRKSATPVEPVPMAAMA